MADEKIVHGKLSSIDASGNVSFRVTNIDDAESETSVVPFCVCNTNSITAEKIATTTSFFELKKGVLSVVKFYSTNSVNNMKLNINNTGAKPVFYHGEAIGKDILKAGTYMFVYDGTNYELIGDPNTGEFQGSNARTAGSSGIVPAPQIGDQSKFLRGDGTWATVEAGARYTAWCSHGVIITNYGLILSHISNFCKYFANKPVVQDALVSKECINI